MLLALANYVCADTTKVLVIDTGINKHKYIPGTNGLCKTGHKDFTFSGLDDDLGHDTNVSGIIHKYAKHYDYCQIVVKYYNKGITKELSLFNMIRSLEYAKEIKPDIINISSSGSGYYSREHDLIKELLDMGIVIIAAAGNDGMMLNSMYCSGNGNCSKYNQYPAGYDKRVYVVGNKYPNGDVYPSSNYGELVDVWRVGVDVEGDYGGVLMTGTSQATAIFTGEYTAKLSRRLRK